MPDPVHPVTAVVAAQRALETYPDHTTIRELHDIILDLAKQADAARGLLQASDDVLGRDWRDTTLNQGNNGDALNAAWDRLVEACEGMPTEEENAHG